MAGTQDAAQVGPVTVEEQRAHFANWAQAPDPLGRRRGIDEATVRRLDKLMALEARLKVMGVQPATVINMLPFELRVYHPLMYDIVCPAKPAGRPYSVTVIREHRIAWRDEGDDNYTPVEFVPIVLAREFEQQHYNQGGVVIYIGDGEKYPPAVEAERNEELRSRIKDAQFRLIGFAREKKREADSEWNTPNRQGARNINETHRQCVALLFDLGEVSEKPPWMDLTKEEAGLGAKCPRCKVVTNQGAYMCTCGFILDPREAFEQNEIDLENPALARLPRAVLEDMGISENVSETTEERRKRLDKEKKAKDKDKAKAAKGSS